MEGIGVRPLSARARRTAWSRGPWGAGETWRLRILWRDRPLRTAARGDDTPWPAVFLRCQGVAESDALARNAGAAATRNDLPLRIGGPRSGCPSRQDCVLHVTELEFGTYGRAGAAEPPEGERRRCGNQSWGLERIPVETRCRPPRELGSRGDGREDCEDDAGQQSSVDGPQSPLWLNRRQKNEWINAGTMHDVASPIEEAARESVGYRWMAAAGERPTGHTMTAATRSARTSPVWVRRRLPRANTSWAKGAAKVALDTVVSAVGKTTHAMRVISATRPVGAVTEYVMTAPDGGSATCEPLSRCRAPS